MRRRKQAQNGEDSSPSVWSGKAPEQEPKPEPETVIQDVIQDVGLPTDTLSRVRRLCFFIIALVSMLSILAFLVDAVVTSRIDAEYFNLPPPPEFEGALSQNQALSHAQRLYEGDLKGPESIVVRDGVLYTGTADGKIVRIQDGVINTVARLGQPPCGAWDDEPTCGRPLGMRFDKQGHLIVVDAYLGLFKVDVTSGHVEKLYGSTEPINGKLPRFLNDLDIAEDGTIYISDSSTKWDRRNNRMAVYENRPDGRLLKFNPKTSTMTEIKSGFYLLNGVQLSPDGDFLLLSETTRCRIFKYHLHGGRKGQLEVFADNLPGLPDNIRPSSGGGYWVSMAVARLPGFELPGYDFLASKPWLRRIMTKVFTPERLIRMIGRPYGLLLELDQSGKVIRSLHDPRGKTIPAVSEVEDVGGVLYMGSYFSPFIGKLDTKSMHY